MAPTHDEIVKPLGDGWAVAWDATARDAKTRDAMDAAIKVSTDAIRAVIGAPSTADSSAPRSPAADRA